MLAAGRSPLVNHRPQRVGTKPAFEATSLCHTSARRSIAQARHSADDAGPTCCCTDHAAGRRLALGGLLSILLQPAAVAVAKPSPGQWSSPGLDASENPDIPKFFKTKSGVKVQELAQGSGEGVVGPNDVVLFDYVLRRSNGYFIYSTIEGVSFQPRDVPVGPVSFRLGPDSKLIQGLQEVLVGMRRGAKRRALVPASEGYTRGGDGVDIYCADAEPQPPTFATKRQLQSHCTEPLLFEVEVLRITPAAVPQS